MRKIKMKRATLINYLTVILILFAASCVTKKSVPQTGIESITFGNGGGFTGAVICYSLSADGQLNKIEKEKNVALKKFDVQTVAQIFEKANELKSFELNEPGNIYSFIEIKTKDNTQRIVWAERSSTTDSRVTHLYNYLMSLTKWR